jgi:hypothetical protein
MISDRMQRGDYLAGKVGARVPFRMTAFRGAGHRAIAFAPSGT